MKRNDGLPFFMFYITYIVGEHIVLPRNAISNVFSGAHGAPLRLGKAQMSLQTVRRVVAPYGKVC